MLLLQLAHAVVEMRDEQRRLLKPWFKREWKTCIRLESKVDALVKAILATTNVELISGEQTPAVPGA